MFEGSELQNGRLFGALRAWTSTATVNLRERRSVVVAAFLLTSIFILFGGLPARWLLAVAGLAVWAAVWPSNASREAMQDDVASLLRGGSAPGGSTWMAIVSALPDPAFVLDGSGNVLTFNQGAIDIFGSTAVGRHISQATRAPELLTAIDVALRTLETQSCRFDFKIPVERSLVGTVAPLASSSANAPQLLVVLRDLSEQELLMRMRSDFVANASHELRTPLASLKGFIETLQGAAKEDTAARDRFLRIMLQQAERMARLIDDLLSLSRIEMRAHVLPRDKADLRLILSHVVQTLGPIAQEKSIGITLAAGTPVGATLPGGQVAEAAGSVTVTGDRDELIQVFQNLIENAIKYGKNGGHVTVTTRVLPAQAPRGERILVSVTDDGPGIAPEHLPRLTERFYRVNAAQSRNAGGTGLGLAIVKHVLNRHQAEMQVDSQLGKGTTFKITFPARS